MKKYKLHLSPQIARDLSDIIFYMQQLGAYESTVQSFLDKVHTAFEFLQATPLLDQSLEQPQRTSGSTSLNSTSFFMRSPTM